MVLHTCSEAQLQAGINRYCMAKIKSWQGGCMVLHQVSGSSQALNSKPVLPSVPPASHDSFLFSSFFLAVQSVFLFFSSLDLHFAAAWTCFFGCHGASSAFCKSNSFTSSYMEKLCPEILGLGISQWLAVSCHILLWSLFLFCLSCHMKECFRQSFPFQGHHGRQCGVLLFT